MAESSQKGLKTTEKYEVAHSPFQKTHTADMLTDNVSLKMNIVQNTG